MNLYDALYLASTPVMAPYFLYKYAVRGKYHESLPAMFGRRLPGAPLAKPPEGALRFWIHAVSVGEVVAARAVAAQLQTALPAARFVISTVTETGQTMARKEFGEHRGIERILYYPLDLSWNVRRFLDVYRPDVFAMMETELWPNMLTLAGRDGVRVFMLNGRISDHSFKSYRRFRFLFRGPLSNLAAAAVQTPTDADRLRELCGPATQIAVTGNCKFDAPAEPLTEPERAAIRLRLLLSEDRRLVVAGSTHPGEEEIVLTAWRAAIRELPDELRRATLVLAPRHPERFDEAADVIARHNFTLSRASRPERHDPEVLLLDQMGVLARIYGVASVAIVCGSFAPIGGHNILEPAVYAVPVIYGPHMHKQKEMLRILDGAHGGLQTTADGLAPLLVELMRDEQRRQNLGRQVKAAVDANRGSARRSVEFILPFLKR